jgi:hypothetical protein
MKKKPDTKTILSDLQGAWICLRESVVEAFGFPGSDRAIFHIDEAMSWESVRNLRRMPPLLLVIRNICTEGGAPQEDGRYINIPYPGGDVPGNIGVCTDVIIRSYRKIRYRSSGIGAYRYEV